MPIIRSSRLYLCYCRIWCVMPWLLVVGGQVLGSKLCVRDEGNCATESHNFPHPWRIACCPAPDHRPKQLPSSRTHSLLSCTWPPTTSNQGITHHMRQLHKYSLEFLVMGIYVPETCWADYKCSKHVEQIISAIKHSVASSWVSSLRSFKESVNCYTKFSYQH